MDTHLKFLNSEYLKHFDKVEIDSEIPGQSLCTDAQTWGVLLYHQEIRQIKPISLNCTVANQRILSILLLTFAIILLDNPAAPLKKALLERGIGKMYSDPSNYLLQPSFSIIVRTQMK